jgi:hypothetical protein
MVKDSGAAVRPDSVAVEFDDERLVANAGVMLTSTLINRLGLERLVDETVELGQRPGAARPGRSHRSKDLFTRRLVEQLGVVRLRDARVGVPESAGDGLKPDAAVQKVRRERPSMHAV